VRGLADLVLEVADRALQLCRLHLLLAMLLRELAGALVRGQLLLERRPGGGLIAPLERLGRPFVPLPGLVAGMFHPLAELDLIGDDTRLVRTRSSSSSMSKIN
jgi:hypothetical protein